VNNVSSPDHGLPSDLGHALRSALGVAEHRIPAFLQAVERVPPEQHPWLGFLLTHLPQRDARTLDPDLLVETCAFVALVRHAAPCSMPIPEDVFRDYVLPYAFLDEERDRWRPLLYRRFAEIARRSASVADCVATLNREVFTQLGVTYHPTRRPHDNQSVQESIAAGFASCTGLSILLAAACRAVGLPARLVGTPLWTDGSGNHTWVEVWDHGEWHFVGASEPGPYDLTWFNDRARSVRLEQPEHGVYAARYTSSDTHFPLAWSPADVTIPAAAVTARYQQVAPTPWNATDIIVEPRRTFCPRVNGPLQVTGRLDDPAWGDVPWSAPFVDIEGHLKPTPRFRTRAKFCWDDRYLYVGAYLEDPHVWGTLTEKNAILFNDPDFEVFLDPDRDHHNYYELEVNALGTIWELTLDRPYRDGGPIHRGDNMPGLITAVHVSGTLNDPSDVDDGWTVEIAIPWTGLARYCQHTACPPRAGDRWHLNLSRVQWLVDIVDGVYRKVPREAHPEDNWVWTPQDAIDMHRPEKWGVLEFTDAPPSSATGCPDRDPFHAARERLMEVHRAQVERDAPSLNAEDFPERGVRDPSLGALRITATKTGALLSVPVQDPAGRRFVARVDHEGRFSVEPA
jgi:transglutaminase-like putative cysteine protease